MRTDKKYQKNNCMKLKGTKIQEKQLNHTKESQVNKTNLANGKVSQIYDDKIISKKNCISESLSKETNSSSSSSDQVNYHNKYK